VQPTKNQFAYSAILLLIALTFVGALFGPNLKAQFGLLDDHEILGYVQKAAGDFRYFFEFIGSSEVGNFGHSVRFRPGYYTIYVTEALVWGANPFLWYLFRFLMCATFVFACLKVVSRYYGLATAVLFVALMFSYTYWTDVWSRLGPGESYCAFGWALFSLGFIELISKTPPKREWPYSLLILFGVLIGAGGKENFLLLLLPVLILGWVRYRRNTLSAGLFLMLVLSVAYIAMITVELLMAFSEGRPDAHVEAVDVGSRLRTLKKMASLPAFYHSLAAFAFGAFAWLLSYRSPRIEPLRSSILAFAIIGLCGLFLIFTQLIFYHGDWPANVRFDFPGMMTTPLIVIATASLATGFIRLFWPRTPRFVIPLLIALVYGSTLARGLKEVRAGSIRNEQLTESIKTKIDLIAKALKADPKAALVLETYDAYNYEYIVSIQKHLRFYGVENPIAVRIHGYNVKDQPSELLKILAARILEWDEAGQKVLATAPKCYSAHISGREPTNCQDLTDFFR
jgi:hypothetical protein